MLSWENAFLKTQATEILNQGSIESDIVGGICQRAWVEINDRALTYNVRELKSLLSAKTKLMGVVKADAYGHGACKVSQSILEAGADWLAVATVPEGIELRLAGIEAPILILGATDQPEQIQAIAHWELQPTIGTPQQALVFSETLSYYTEAMPVHLKLDTGMSRLGTSWQQAVEFVKFVQGLPNLKIASIYSHLATADESDQTVMRQQHQRFQEAIGLCCIDGKGFPGDIRLHLANSAATLTDSALHYDMVRVGLAIYGLYPAPHLQEKIKLKPAMEVKARVTQVKTIEAGTGVSYGYKFIAPKQMRLAVVGIGYADGIPRNLSNKMKVIVRDRLIRQVGAITMDQLMLDVSDIADLETGEVVTLLGQVGEHRISAEDWANTLGTISWEILCGFKHRLPRVGV
ncbi:alanine racemase [Okeania sp.]|uniref:alanine racemase n=1 Tax=Okeania sp. TaxID=3100323 RepID=UPI002B4ADFE9|nr:alanine racemase [Okeania sp.]MEB3341532.1 alanine racemase [Okeania sp.]